MEKYYLKVSTQITAKKLSKEKFSKLKSMFKNRSDAVIRDRVRFRNLKKETV